MSSVLHEWQTLGHRYRLCQWGTRIEGWSPLESSEARWVLRACLSRPDARWAFSAALQKVAGSSLSRNLTDDASIERVIGRLRLLVLEQPITPIRLGHRPTTETQPQLLRELVPRRQRAWIEITVLEDSRPAKALAGALFRLDLPDASTREGSLNGQGNLRIDDIEPGKCWLELTDSGSEEGGKHVDVISPQAKYVRTDGTDRAALLELRTDRHHVIVVQRPPIWVLDPPGLYYETNGIIWLPLVSLTSQSITALDGFRTIFDFLGQQSGVRLLVAGHTDAVGSEAVNTDLATERADLVMLFLIGDRTAWAAACTGRDTVSIWQQVLTWAALFLGWDCHPGEIDNDLGPLTAGALERFRGTYNDVFGASLPTRGGFSTQDWEAVFDLYEAALARLLAVSLEGLAELRDQLRFTVPGTIGCGESFPAMFVAPEQALLWNRRVDLIFCKSDHMPALDPEPPGSVIYEGRVHRIPVPVDPRAVEPLGRLWFVMLSECGQDPVPDLEFVLVRGGRQIKARTDSRGIYDGGTVLSARYELLIGDDRVVCPTIDLDDLEPYPLYFYPEITAEARAATGETPEEDETGPEVFA